MEAVLHIMSYMKLKHNSRLELNAVDSNIYESNFRDCDGMQLTYPMQCSNTQGDRRMSSVLWYSNKQSTIGTSAFCAEFVALKVGVGTLHAIWYKLKIMSISTPGPKGTYGYKS